MTHDPHLKASIRLLAVSVLASSALFIVGGVACTLTSIWAADDTIAARYESTAGVLLFIALVFGVVGALLWCLPGRRSR